jgi:hypothetical protein
MIPSSDREWNPEDKTWKIRRTHLESISKILKQCSFQTTVDTIDRAVRIVEKTDWIKEIFSLCPPQHYAKLYKGMMSSFHPDVGGNNDIAKRINMEFQRLTGGK